jgi:UDP-N-acetylmuramoylalanine--D-glutamate ligase
MVPGGHNQANAQAAWAAARQFGVSRRTAAKALAAFTGLPHRLQFVAAKGGVRYYNDSKCTTPQGVIVALKAFTPRSAVIIVGGSDKGAPFDKLAAALAGMAKAVITMGETGPAIGKLTLQCRRGAAPPVEPARDLAHAVRQARQFARAGDAILLSPACASFDMFRNYEHRGEAFTRLVAKLHG